MRFRAQTLGYGRDRINSLGKFPGSVRLIKKVFLLVKAQKSVNLGLIEKMEMAPIGIGPGNFPHRRSGDWITYDFSWVPLMSQSEERATLRIRRNGTETNSERLQYLHDTHRWYQHIRDGLYMRECTSPEIRISWARNERLNCFFSLVTFKIHVTHILKPRLSTGDKIYLLFISHTIINT